MFVEIFIYLLIAFGILILCITMFEKECSIDQKYMIITKDNIKVKVIVEAYDLNEEDIKKLDWIIRKGKYQDIYDVAYEYKVLTK